ncbi:unnamed protein product [Ambrosiozyma monospora]|uniref:Unnamed protein product n=1 Tax=Ambrosiozyma monospora TaxID=43982 RepID=A0A9W6SYS3_AMBMO|nr:unnamed protein product [Ambrosiozyma monospora]
MVYYNLYRPSILIVSLSMNSLMEVIKGMELGSIAGVEENTQVNSDSCKSRQNQGETAQYDLITNSERTNIKIQMPQSDHQF